MLYLTSATPDNDSLTFMASTSVPAVATAHITGSVVTVTPVAVGSATITVTAQDPDGPECDSELRGNGKPCAGSKHSGSKP